MAEIQTKLITAAYTKSINEKERTVTAWASKAIIDRDKEMIKGDAWELDSYMRHPIILLSHQYQDLWIGKALKLEPSNEGLKFTAKFATNKMAQEVFQLVQDTGMAAFSVGFIPKTWEEKNVDELDEIDRKTLKEAGASDKDKIKIYTKCELLEISLVSVPSCSTAVLCAYNEGKIKTKELKDKLDGVVRIIDKMDEKAEEDMKDIQDIDEDTKEDIKKDIKAEIITKPETTENYHRIPVDEGNHSKHELRTMVLGDEEKGIKGLYCVDCKKIITYLFDVNKWKMEDAKKWVKDNAKEYEGMTEDKFKEKLEEKPKEKLEEKLGEKLEEKLGEKLEEKPEKKSEIKLEEKAEATIYADGKAMIELATKYGSLITENIRLKEELKVKEEIIINLTKNIKEIELKQGAVLNRKNKQALIDAREGCEEVIDSIQEVLDSSEPPNEEIGMPINIISSSAKNTNTIKKTENPNLSAKEIQQIILEAIKEQVVRPIEKRIDISDKEFKDSIINTEKRYRGKVL